MPRDRKRKLSRNTDHWVLVTWSNLRSLIYCFSWHQKMKSNMAHRKICKNKMFPWGDITLLTIDLLLIFKNMFLCWQHGFPKKKYRRRKIPDQKRSWKSLSPRRSPGPAVTQVHLGWTYYKGRKDELDPLITLPGGVALPPSQLRMMQEQSIDNTSLAYQGMSREALREMINGEATRNSISPRCFIIQELLEEKTVWGRGLVSRSVL